jgi:hypothetical protein
LKKSGVGGKVLVTSGRHTVDATPNPPDVFAVSRRIVVGDPACVSEAIAP